MARELPSDPDAPFVPIRDAEQLLGRTRSTLQRLFPHMVRLEFPSNSRVFARPYLEVLKPHLPDTRGLPTAAEHFARTDEAHATILQFKEYWNTQLTDAIGNSESIRALDAAQILCIGRMTLSNWEQQGHLPGVFTNGRETHIPRETFFNLTQLHYPQTYDPTAR